MSSIKTTDIAAVVISLCALFLATFQACETIESNKIAVRPNIDITFSGVRGSNEPHGFKVSNSGVGPAIIDSVEFYVDGIKVEADLFDIWSTILNKVGWESTTDFDEFHIIHLPVGYYLKEEQDEYLLKLLPSEGNDKRELTNEEWAKLNRVGVKINYSSMQNEKCSIHYTPANEQAYVRQKCC